MPLTQPQVHTIRATVPVLQSRGNDITTHFYHTLLEEHPELNSVFNQANQANNHQAQALAGSLYAYASHIDDLGALSPAVERICQKHASLYIRPEQYAVVGEYLLRAMGEVLGKEVVTAEVLEAWGEAYWQLANLMINREEAILSADEDWKDWRNFRIAKKVPEAEGIASFYLEPVDGKPLPKFLPGQYVSLKMDVPGLGYQQSRQYSLSAAPRQDYYRISVKKDPGLAVGKEGAEVQPGFVSNVLHDMTREGDVVGVSHPAGCFYLDPEAGETGAVVLISAGVGVTPMVSILDTLIAAKSSRRISWIHATRTTALQAFGAHITQVSQDHQNVVRTIFVKNPVKGKDKEGLDYQHTGRMRLDALDRKRELCLDDGKAEYYICGPEGFMIDIAEGLRTLGVDDERMQMEVFGTGEIPKA